MKRWLRGQTKLGNIISTSICIGFSFPAISWIAWQAIDSGDYGMLFIEILYVSMTVWLIYGLYKRVNSFTLESKQDTDR